MEFLNAYKDFYLLHDLDGNYNSHGIPLLSKDSDLEHGDNVVVYGHNIHKIRRDVFADLAGYEELSFYQKHPVVETVSGQGTLFAGTMGVCYIAQWMD